MQKITVKLAEKSYEIRVGSGILGQAGQWLKENGFSGKAVIITDSYVKGFYAEILQKSLSEAGFTVTVLDVPAGEAQKTLETAGLLYDGLAESFAERSTLILALGGGVIGDLAGFVAATYMRGIPYIQVPTSLLAMVDSSIGGKTAVDRGKMKNIVGAFYQPRMVIADIATLKTLPKDELSNGMAEAIKMAAIGDSKFFRFLEENTKRAMALDTAVLEKIVVENAAQKAKVVSKDEKESGGRITLNYGHTVGHAFESVSGFKLKHGQAVAIGMVAENSIARRRGLLPERQSFRIKQVIGEAGLPVSIPDLSTGEKERVLELIKHDKKVFNNKVRFVLLKNIGRPVIVDDIDPELIKEVLYGRGS
jgi:3-dehydroquinate synthase